MTGDNPRQCSFGQKRKEEKYQHDQEGVVEDFVDDRQLIIFSGKEIIEHSWLLSGLKDSK